MSWIEAFSFANGPFDGVDDVGGADPVDRLVVVERHRGVGDLGRLEVAQVERQPSRAALRQLREGVELDDGPSAPAQVALVDPTLVRLVIHEGRNRQVRRMLEAVGHPVIRLIRTRIGPLSDRRLSPGAWRELSGPELRALQEAVADDVGNGRGPEGDDR